ncbi:2-keto-4-pentenoate hydratase [Actinomycetospora flava]|uniref:2-keto-4-pentenoate hydratase n=1 Tax=Actinomycetospora flava TaxID=3129232 RepID=A0ABU8MEK2_9PSEU
MSPTEHTAAAPPAALSAAQIDQALEHARRHQAPIEPLTTTYPGLDVAGAYAIQRVGLRRRLDAHGVVVGHKIGLTSAAMQRQLGVEEPDYGYLLADMILHDPGETPPSTSAAQFCQPRIEPEVAFRLAAPLGGPGITPGDVLAACDPIAPALEIVDIQDWRIALADTIADNASSAAVVLGPWIPLDQVTAPRELTAELI